MSASPVFARWHRDLSVARAEIDSALAAARDGDMEDILVYSSSATQRLQTVQAAIEGGDVVRETGR